MTTNDAAQAAVQEDSNVEAVYQLESPVVCPSCRQTVSTLKVIRMLRTRVNFTSTLPRRGRVVSCSACSTVISAELGNLS